MATKKEEPVKKLEARVKDSFFMPSVRAFSGWEFTKNEWRPVPDGFEEQAKTHELLEVREAGTEKVMIQKAKVKKEVATFPIPDPGASPEDESADESTDESAGDEEGMTPAQKRAARKAAAKNKAED